LTRPAPAHRVAHSMKTRFPPLSVVLLGLAACLGQPVDRAPPVDAFYFPESLAVRHLDASGQDCVGGAPGCTTQLLVVSTNFDMRYDPERGGTLLSVAVPPDPAVPPADSDLPLRPPLDVRGAVRIGSLGGTLALLEDRPTLAAQVLGGSERICPGWSTAADPGRDPQALVASRVTRRLHRVGLRGDLGLECADGCATSLDDPATADDDRYHDPYGVGVVCRGSGRAYRALAFVSFLSTPGNAGVLGGVDLAGGGLLAPLGVGVDAAHTMAYDPAGDRLFFTGRFAGTVTMPFRFMDLGNTQATEVRAFDFASQATGAETRGFALSTNRRRAYVALRLYDPILAGRVGARTPDVGGALAILDMTPDAILGIPDVRLVDVVRVGLGPTDVAAIPRSGRRDLVAISSTNDDTVWLYDDESSAVAKVFAGGSLAPALGKQPAGLAAEARADGHFRLYVASFGSHAVSVIDVDPAAPARARHHMTLGGQR